MADRFALERRTATAMLLSGAALLGSKAIGAKAEVSRPTGSVLGTAAQLAAERSLLRLLADPAVKAAQARLLADLRADPVAQTPDGGARLENAIAEWTTSL